MKNKLCFVLMLGCCLMSNLTCASSSSSDANLKVKMPVRKQDAPRVVEQERSENVVITKKSELSDDDIKAWIDQCHAHRHPMLLRFHVMRVKNQQLQAEAARVTALRNVRANVD